MYREIPFNYLLLMLLMGRNLYIYLFLWGTQFEYLLYCSGRNSNLSSIARDATVSESRIWDATSKIPFKVHLRKPKILMPKRNTEQIFP